MLSPGSKHRVDNGAAFFETCSHEVLSGLVHSDFGGHGAEDANFIRDLQRLREETGDLKPCFSGHGIGWPFAVAFLGIEGVDVTHAADEVEQNYGLGGAKPSAAFHFSRLAFGAEIIAWKKRKDGKTKRGFGNFFDERTAAEAVEAEQGRFHGIKNVDGESRWLLHKEEFT